MDPDHSASARTCARLTVAGFSPLRASDEIEALSTVRNESPDLAFLHIAPEYLSDTDLAEVMRSVAETPYLPVMVFAGDESRRVCYLDGGADDVVSASTTDEEVLARIRALLRIKNVHDELAESRGQLQEALRRERKWLSKLRTDYAHLMEMATTDPLTHVHNVRSFKELLEHEFKVARRYDKPISMLMLDVDHFKVVNDTHGHPSGDYVLKELAVILKTSVRESDIVARTGGEEFSVVLPRATRDQAEQFAQRIRQSTSQRQFIVYGKEIHITISIGAATYPQDAEITEPDMLVYFADQALLRAKEQGRDRVVSFGEFDNATRVRLRRKHLQMQAMIQEGADPCEEAAITGPPTKR